jgi:SAM-dependent methyltransferase
VLLPSPPASAAEAPTSVQAVDKWEAQAEALLTSPVEQMTACDLIDFYFNNSGVNATIDDYYYFVFRFSQPRHLVPLAFASVIQQPKKPILDLACGFGHVTRCLLPRAKDQLVIGMDRNFFALYVARHWLASKAKYVCGAADASLPFRDAAFSAAFCMDAFHVFPNKVNCIRELKRLTQEEGTIILSSLRNRLVNAEPFSWASLLPPKGYEALVADMPHCMVADREVLDRYLQKQGPSLVRSAEIEDLANEQWLSIVASHRRELFQNYGSFEDWPHADGCLSLNPLYVEDGRDQLGNLRLRRVFPSAWYKEENAVYGHQHYLPETVSVKETALADLGHRKRSPDVDQLIEQCVVVGMPERFMPASFSRIR